MADPREPWNIHPAKKRASVSASIKAEVEDKATSLIENVLKPKHVATPPEDGQFILGAAETGTNCSRLRIGINC